MYKVLIIDDEPIIRKGLTSIINWSQLNCEICGEASDGQMGINLVRQLKPDIILTDISMPKVDGLSMIREVKSEVPQAKIIILTGYRDFNYAQEAIKLEAFDFVLKPTKIEEMTEVVKRAVAALTHEKGRDEELSRFRALYEKNIPLLREKLLYNLLYGVYTSQGDIEEQMERLGLKFGSFVMGIIDNESHHQKDGYALQLYQFGIISTLEEALAEEYALVSTALNSHQLLFVVNLREGEPYHAERLQEKLAYLQEMIDNCFSFTVSIAVSSAGLSYRDLPAKLKECQSALEHRFYLGGNAIINYSDLTAFFRYEDHSLLDQQQKLLMEQINAGNCEAVLRTVETIREYTASLKPDDKSYIKSFYLSTLSSINSIRSSLIRTSQERPSEALSVTSLYTLVEGCESISDLSDILREASRKAAENINSFNQKNMKLLMKNAVDYLQEHFNEPITLSEVAGKIFVSTYYLSRMFKKELNKNFVDYLNEIRMDKARELLKDMNLRTYEIADTVGISDPHYFSKLFKKYVGMTPTEYREQNS